MTCAEYVLNNTIASLQAAGSVIQGHVTAAKSAGIAIGLDVDGIQAALLAGDVAALEEAADEAMDIVGSMAADEAERFMKSVIRSLSKESPELATILERLPEIAEAFLQVATEHDIAPFIHLITTDKTLSGIVPFPPEVIKIAFAMQAHDVDMLQIEALKLFSYMLGIKPLYEFLTSAQGAGDGSVTGFAGFLEAKVIQILTERAEGIKDQAKVAIMGKVSEGEAKVRAKVGQIEAKVRALIPPEAEVMITLSALC